MESVTLVGIKIHKWELTDFTFQNDREANENCYVLSFIIL